MSREEHVPKNCFGLIQINFMNRIFKVKLIQNLKGNKIKKNNKNKRMNKCLKILDNSEKILKNHNHKKNKRSEKIAFNLSLQLKEYFAIAKKLNV
jgi:hypothetical protein